MKKILDNKIFKIIYGIIRFLFVSLMVLYLGFVIYQRISNNASIFGYRIFTVATGSMEPVYMVNDVILVKEIDSKKLKIGDDVAYNDTKNGIIITHRIVRIEVNEVGDTRYYLKGVNNEYEDPSVGAEQILGKVQGKVFLVNFINHVVKNIYGFFFLVFCPLVLVIFLEIADTIIDNKLDNNEIRLIDDEDDEDDEVLEVKDKGDDGEEVI